MTKSVKPIPEGYHSLTPFLSVPDIRSALDFYATVFGAKEIMRLTDPTGKPIHAEIRVGDSPIMIDEEFPDLGVQAPLAAGGTSVSLRFYVEDVDAVFARAIAAGAKVIFPVADQFYGDRGGRFADPFGHYWIVATHKEDVSFEEARRRANELRGKGESDPFRKGDPT